MRDCKRILIVVTALAMNQGTFVWGHTHENLQSEPLLAHVKVFHISSMNAELPDGWHWHWNFLGHFIVQPQRPQSILSEFPNVLKTPQLENFTLPGTCFSQDWCRPPQLAWYYNHRRNVPGSERLYLTLQSLRI